MDDKIAKAIEEMREVAKLPKPWEDCICERVAGDNKLCVIHKPSTRQVVGEVVE